MPTRPRAVLTVPLRTEFYVRLAPNDMTGCPRRTVLPPSYRWFVLAAQPPVPHLLMPFGSPCASFFSGPRRALPAFLGFATLCGF